MENINYINFNDLIFQREDYLNHFLNDHLIRYIFFHLYFYINLIYKIIPFYNDEFNNNFFN